MKCAKCGELIVSGACGKCTSTKAIKLPPLPKKSLDMMQAQIEAQKKQKNPFRMEKDHYIVCPPFPPHKLSKEQAFSLGREAGNQMILASHEVSRFHLSVRWDDSSYVVQDLNSSNGTYVNGEKIQSFVLNNGDIISIGSHSLIYQEVPRGTEPKVGSSAEKPMAETLQVEVTESAVQHLVSSSSLKQFRSTLQGDIESMGLFGVLQLLANEKKLGCLKVTGSDRVALIYLEEGCIIHCLNGDLLGPDAFFDLLMWQKGDFKFKTDEKAPQATIECDVESMLLEAARRIDEGMR